MKRLVCVLIVLLLVPCFSFADDSPYFGKWVGTEHHAIKSFETLHYLDISSFGFSDYLFLHIFTSLKTETAKAYSGKWTALDDGKIRIPTSSITYIDLEITEEGTLKCKDPKVEFVRLP